MKELYYINFGEYTKECLLIALKKAFLIVELDSDVESITILISTSSQKYLLSEVFSSDDVKNKCCHIDELRVGIRFETVKTYCQCHTSKHILIPLCVSPNDYLKFEDNWYAYYWIVVPWTLEESEDWLKVHSAIDVKTNIIIANNYVLDEQVKNAIDWIKATSFPNEGFQHPLDLNRLKSMANALVTCGYITEYYSVLYYCFMCVH